VATGNVIVVVFVICPGVVAPATPNVMACLAYAEADVISYKPQLVDPDVLDVPDSSAVFTVAAVPENNAQYTVPGAV
jgi:hypothetical protein